jgi:hypothetical protein
MFVCFLCHQSCDLQHVWWLKHTFSLICLLFIFPVLIVHIRSTDHIPSAYCSYSQCLLFIFSVLIIVHTPSTHSSFVFLIWVIPGNKQGLDAYCSYSQYWSLFVLGFFSPIIYIIKKIILFIINLVDFKDYLFCHLFWAIGIFNKLFL